MPKHKSDYCPKCGSGRTKYLSHFENEYGITYDLECRDCDHVFSYDKEKEQCLSTKQ